MCWWRCFPKLLFLMAQFNRSLKLSHTQAVFYHRLDFINYLPEPPFWEVGSKWVCMLICYAFFPKFPDFHADWNVCHVFFIIWILREKTVLVKPNTLDEASHWVECSRSVKLTALISIRSIKLTALLLIKAVNLTGLFLFQKIKFCPCQTGWRSLPWGCNHIFLKIWQKCLV